MSKLPSYAALANGMTTGEFRRFKEEGQGGMGHMLFRPIGQIALAQALGQLVFARQPSMSLSEAFKRLAEFDKDGGFEMERPLSLWYMVLYDPQKKRMLVSGRDLAARLLVYMVGGGIVDAAEREKLREDLQTARTFNDKIIGFDDKPVSKIKLPPPL